MDPCLDKEGVTDPLRAEIRIILVVPIKHSE